MNHEPEQASTFQQPLKLDDSYLELFHKLRLVAEPEGCDDRNHGLLA
ncbi:MAG: hypothetical protein M1511_01350 [Deltaproteobacteria bacterium]|nr:hypothetical protein [Deltaproteobacteria bacterium]